jgi:hypothetical protein
MERKTAEIHQRAHVEHVTEESGIMTEINLTQTETNALIALEKQRETDDVWQYPQLGGQINIPLISVDKRERFVLDISRSNALSKLKFRTARRK